MQPPNRGPADRRRVRASQFGRKRCDGLLPGTLRVSRRRLCTSAEYIPCFKISPASKPAVATSLSISPARRHWVTDFSKALCSPVSVLSVRERCPASFVRGMELLNNVAHL